VQVYIANLIMSPNSVVAAIGQKDASIADPRKPLLCVYTLSIADKRDGLPHPGRIRGAVAKGAGPGPRIELRITQKVSNLRGSLQFLQIPIARPTGGGQVLRFPIGIIVIQMVRPQNMQPYVGIFRPPAILTPIVGTYFGKLCHLAKEIDPSLIPGRFSHGNQCRYFRFFGHAPTP
jgi:hypothetical protein